MAELLTDDIVWSDPALPAPVYGIPAVQDFMRASFRTFSDLRFSEPDPPHFTVTGDLVAWEWRMEGTMTGAADPPGFAPTGKSVRIDGVDLWTMRDGRIARYQAFYDMTDVARQLGLMPERGSAGERAMVALQRLQARFMHR
jgi:steroid delta-isomerase-like uncharacterized protein